MKKINKVISILIAMVILTSVSIYGEETQVAETPSIWAIWDVQMSNTYGLGDMDSYNNYKDTVKGSEFLTIQSSFETKFEVIDENKVMDDSSLTRGEVIKELYDIIGLALDINASEISNEDALNYFVDNELIAGRSNGDYALNKKCTKEEMFVFSKRVYDYLIYSLNLDSKGMFWEVSDEDNTVYLLGSVHVTDGSVYPMNKYILDSFINSDFLVVEANILEPKAEDMLYIQEKMMLQEGTTIDELISKETYDAYVESVSVTGIAPEIYNSLKPWYAAMLIQNLSMAKADYSGSLGIDIYFLSMAYNWKPIVELEGIKYQIDMFDSFSKELQEAYLLGVLEGEDSTQETMDDMLLKWKNGDAKGLEELVFSTEATSGVDKEFNEKLWDIRNANMVESIEEYLSTDSENDYFVVVGAGHMLNHNGIVSGLIDLGYTVEQVK